VKTYELQPTKSPHLFRNVDLNGDWQEYYNSKTKEYKRGLTTVLGRSYPKGFGFYEALKNTTAEEWERRLSEAGDQGDAIHQLIEMALSGIKVNMATDILAENNKDKRKPTVTEWKKYLRFVDFVNLHGIYVLDHELTVEHEKFVGTLDQFWVITKSCGLDKRCCRCSEFLNKKLVNDVKTGKGLYPNHKSQIAALGKAVSAEGTMLLHLNGTDRGWSVKFFGPEETASAYERCMAAFTIDDESYKPFDPTSIEDIPETAELHLLETPKFLVVGSKNIGGLFEKIPPVPKSQSKKPAKGKKVGKQHK
jgi:hypothetical protein